MTQLSANLNKVALLRNTRTIGIPSVERAAHLVLDAGAHGITVHPRPDGRHVRAHDVRELAEDVGDDRGVEEHADADTATLVGRFGARSRVRPGQPIEVAVDTRSLHFFDPQTGLGIYDGTRPKGAE